MSDYLRGADVALLVVVLTLELAAHAAQLVAVEWRDLDVGGEAIEVHTHASLRHDDTGVAALVLDDLEHDVVVLEDLQR